jgi:thymidylate synthase
MHAHWRSRDAFKAAFMNIFALTDLQRAVGERIAAATGRDIRVGAYVDFTDSYHIYGSYYGDLQRFLETVEKRSWEERTWPSAFAEPMFEDARERLREESGKAG